MQSYTDCGADANGKQQFTVLSGSKLVSGLWRKFHAIAQSTVKRAKFTVFVLISNASSNSFIVPFCIFFFVSFIISVKKWIVEVQDKILFLKRSIWFCTRWRSRSLDTRTQEEAKPVLNLLKCRYVQQNQVQDVLSSAVTFSSTIQSKH